MHDAATFPPAPEAASDARQWLRRTLSGWSVTRRLDDVELMTGELVANAVQHAATPFTVQADLDGSTLRVTVVDGAAPAPEPRDPSPLATSGRGLRIVEALATRWGWDQLPDGKQVWFELALD